MCAYKLTSLSGRSALRVKRVQTHGEPGGSYLEIWGGLQHVASTTVSWKSLLLIPFNVGLLPTAEWVPLLEAYFIMHLKGVLRSIACASTSRWDSRGEISCMVPMVPSLEKEEDKSGWSLREQPECEPAGIRKEKTSNEILLFQSRLSHLGLYPQNVPWFSLGPANHFSFLPWNHKVEEETEAHVGNVTCSRSLTASWWKSWVVSGDFLITCLTSPARTTKVTVHSELCWAASLFGDAALHLWVLSVCSSGDFTRPASSRPGHNHVRGKF